MSIDRIGKGGSPPVGGAATGTPSAGPTAETGKPFEVKRPDASAPAQPTSAVADTSPLEQLQVGKLDLDGPHQIGRLAVFAGVRNLPTRVKCAILPWHTLQAAIDSQAQVCTETGAETIPH